MFGAFTQIINIDKLKKIIMAHSQNKYWELALGEFMQGTLEGNALNEFQQWLKTDKELKTELAFRQKLVKTLKYEQELHFLEQLNHVKAAVETTQNTPKQGTNSQWIWWIGGAILLIIIGFFGIQKYNQQQFVSQLQQTIEDNNYLQPLTVNFGFGEDNPLKSAFDDYQAGNYTEAIPKFDTVLKENPFEEFQDIHAFLAISYLLDKETPQPKTAIEHLTILRNSEAYKNDETILFYLALAYIEDGQTDNAKSQLEIIQKNENNQYKEAINTLLQQY